MFSNKMKLVAFHLALFCLIIDNLVSAKGIKSPFSQIPRCMALNDISVGNEDLTNQIVCVMFNGQWLYLNMNNYLSQNKIDFNKLSSDLSAKLSKNGVNEIVNHIGYEDAFDDDANTNSQESTEAAQEQPMMKRSGSGIKRYSTVINKFPFRIGRK